MLETYSTLQKIHNPNAYTQNIRMFRVHLYRILMVVYDVLHYLPYGFVHELNSFNDRVSRLSSDVKCKQDTTLRTSTPTNV